MGRRQTPWLLVVVCLGAVSVSAQPAEVLDRVERARSLRSHGSLLEALKAYEGVLPELRRTGPGPLLARVLLEASQAAISTGDYRRAIDYAGESARTARRLDDAGAEGSAFNQIGQAHLYQGDYAAALANFQRAYEIADWQHDANAASVRMGNIGNVHFFQGRYLDALQSYELALEKSGGLPATASNGRQLALANIAILYEQLGQNQKALSYYQRALADTSELMPNEYAQLLSNVGTLYRRMGDPVKALENYQAARRSFARDQHSDSEIHVLHNIGLLLALDQHAPDRALVPFTEALKLAETTANRRQALLGHLYKGEALLRLGRFSEARTEFDAALAGSKQVGAAEEQWTALYGVGQACGSLGERTAALDSYGQAISVIEGLRSDLRASSLKAEFLANKRNVFDAYIAALLDEGRFHQEQLFELFEKARSRNLQDSLRSRLGKATIASVQRQLAADAMLIEFWLGRGRLGALWITRSASGVVRRDVSADDLAGLRQLATVFASEETPASAPAAAAAGRLLFAGIPLSATQRTLLIVPDGILNSLPFDVLPSPRSRGMMVEDFAISYLPAAGLLLRAGASEGRTMPWRRQLLGLGDPLPPQADELNATERWARLPDAAREVRSVAGALPGRAEVHLGTDNLKRYLVAATGVPVLHLSTHAAVDLIDPNRSRILFTAERGSSGSKYLFWQEAQHLPLAGVDLVTLSACETEGGKLVPGEGIQSFSRAFLSAGAGSTVTSLWRVADGPTAEFMRRFYREMARGRSKAEALRQAKLAFLHSGTRLQNPTFWAAFVLTGNGQKPLPVMGWWIVIVPLALVAAAAAAAWLFVSRRRMRAALN